MAAVLPYDFGLRFRGLFDVPFQFGIKGTIFHSKPHDEFAESFTLWIIKRLGFCEDRCCEHVSYTCWLPTLKYALDRRCKPDITLVSCGDLIFPRRKSQGLRYFELLGERTCNLLS